MEALERLVGQETTQQRFGGSNTIDVYAAGTDALYTPPFPGAGLPQQPPSIGPLHQPQSMVGPYEPPQPFGNGGYVESQGQSDFTFGSRHNIQQDHNIGKLTGDSSLSQYNLSERYDLSGHNGTPPHLNQSVNDMARSNNFGQPKDIITGGVSNKSMDGYKGLGPAHNINLFDR